MGKAAVVLILGVALALVVFFVVLPRLSHTQVASPSPAPSAVISDPTVPTITADPTTSADPAATAVPVSTELAAPTTPVSISSLPSVCSLTNGLPDPVCTPGAIDPRVTQENIHQTICVSGYTRSVRPSTSYTGKLEREMIKRYQLNLEPSQTEFDHLVSLELGGHPTDPRNLFPQPYLPVPGALEKDRVENKLHKLICNGQISLRDAQLLIARDWLSAYNTYILGR